MAEAARGISLQAAAARDVDLQLGEVKPGRALGDRMFHLQPRVHLHEREAVTLRLVQELDRARIAIVRALAQPHGRFAQKPVLFLGQSGRRRLLQNLLVAPLDRAIAHSGRPRVSVVVRDDLDFHMARALNELLHEDRRVAECLEGFRPCAFKSGLEFADRIHFADSVASAARGSLDQQGEAQPVRVIPRRIERLQGPAAPRSHWYLRLLGQKFGRDFVAEFPHDVAIRADEDNFQLAA